MRYHPQQAALDAQKYSVAKRFEDLAAHASANRVTFYTLQASGLRGVRRGRRGRRPRRAGAPVRHRPADPDHQPQGLAHRPGRRHRRPGDARRQRLPPRAGADAGGFRELLLARLHPRPHRGRPGPPGRGEGEAAGLRVRYRQSYRDKPALEKMADRTLAALFHGIEDNPLEVEIEVGDPTPAEDGQYAVPVRLRIPLFKLAILNQDDDLPGQAPPAGGDARRGRRHLRRAPGRGAAQHPPQGGAERPGPVLRLHADAQDEARRAARRRRRARRDRRHHLLSDPAGGGGSGRPEVRPSRG